jgi:hypothetical protein
MLLGGLEKGQGLAQPGRWVAPPVVQRGVGHQSLTVTVEERVLAHRLVGGDDQGRGTLGIAGAAGVDGLGVSEKALGENARPGCTGPKLGSGVGGALPRQRAEQGPVSWEGRG